MAHTDHDGALTGQTSGEQLQVGLLLQQTTSSSSVYTELTSKRASSSHIIILSLAGAHKTGLGRAHKEDVATIGCNCGIATGGSEIADVRL